MFGGIECIWVLDMSGGAFGWERAIATAFSFGVDRYALILMYHDTAAV